MSIRPNRRLRRRWSPLPKCLRCATQDRRGVPVWLLCALPAFQARRSEEHTSELQSLMRISYAVFCLKKKTKLEDPTLHLNKIAHHVNLITIITHIDNI